ncbi:hypothetical protein LIER_25501 [Lithospermum erythrorhizon]|uniref:Uncharacterized protein n=1 Tax=Lithospermum erythrorhizon TaxID=34254 RepID=A0AAV3R813_LITER
MPLDSNSSTLSNLATTSQTCIFRRPKIWFRRTRRRLPIVRLGGGGEAKQRRGLILVKTMLRRLKLKWLKLKYITMMKKLKEYYHGLIKDIIQGAGTLDAFQQRLLLETSFAVPVMGVSFNSFSTSNNNTDHNMVF